MKKNIIILTLCLLVATPSLAAPIVFDTSAPDASRKTIGIFLEAPASYVSSEKVRAVIPEKIIPMFPKHLFNVLPFDQTAMAVRTYREDNRMMVSQYMSTPLNRSDIQKVGKELKCDYVLWLKVENSQPRVGAGLFSISFKTTVTVDVRLLNIETMKYLMSKEIVKDGSSTAVYLGIPSFENAYAEALQKALDEFHIPPATLTEMSAGTK